MTTGWPERTCASLHDDSPGAVDAATGAAMRTGAPPVVADQLQLKFAASSVLPVPL